MNPACIDFSGFGLRFIEYARSIQVTDRCAARNRRAKSGIFRDCRPDAHPNFRRTRPFPLIGRRVGHTRGGQGYAQFAASVVMGNGIVVALGQADFRSRPGQQADRWRRLIQRQMLVKTACNGVLLCCPDARRDAAPQNPGMYLPHVKAAICAADFPHIHLSARSGFHCTGRLNIQGIGISAVSADPGNHQEKGCGNLRRFPFRALDDQIHALRLVIRRKIVGGKAVNVRCQNRHEVLRRPKTLHGRFVR